MKRTTMVVTAFLVAWMVKGTEWKTVSEKLD